MRRRRRTTYQLRIDRINAEAAAACEVALAITKLAFEGPIILKGFRTLSLCKDVPRFIEILKAQDAHEPINMTRSNPTGPTNVMGI